MSAPLPRPATTSAADPSDQERGRPRGARGGRWRALVVVAALAALAAGCERGRIDSEDGTLVFDQICARCHGRDGRGEAIAVRRFGVPDLTSPAWQRSRSDDDVRRVIREGAADGRMPAFAKVLTPAQIDALVARVRALGRGDGGAPVR